MQMGRLAPHIGGGMRLQLREGRGHRLGRGHIAHLLDMQGLVIVLVSHVQDKAKVVVEYGR